MDLPLGPLLAHILMAKLGWGPLEEAISSLNMHTRYREDTPIIWDSKTGVNNSLCNFNNVHSAAGFTMEFKAMTCFRFRM